MPLQELFHCPNCNAALDLEGESPAIIRCDYCRSMVIVPEPLRQKTALSPLEEPVKIKKPPKPGKPKLSEQEAVAKVTELARNGQAVEAMKLYREAFPVGLMEAKAAIDQVELGLPLPNPAARWEDEQDLPVAAAEEITKLVASGKMAEAARLYRITFDTSHAEAETAVEQLLEGKSINVARQQAKKESQATAVRRQPETVPGTGPSMVLVLGIVLAIVVVIAFIAGIVLIAAF